MSRAPAVRLVDDFQAGYLKFAGREPRTLEELAIAREECRHRGRLAEVKRLAKKLALLDAFLKPLADRGVKLSRYDYQSFDQGKTLRIMSALMQPENALHAALLELGFKELERKDWGRTDVVTLQHGRWLVVAIDVTKQQAVTVEINQPARA